MIKCFNIEMYIKIKKSKVKKFHFVYSIIIIEVIIFILVYYVIYLLLLYLRFRVRSIFFRSNNIRL
jgi:hypothetical protein